MKQVSLKAEVRFSFWRWTLKLQGIYWALVGVRAVTGQLGTSTWSEFFATFAASAIAAIFFEAARASISVAPPAQKGGAQ